MGQCCGLDDEGMEEINAERQLGQQGQEETSEARAVNKRRLPNEPTQQEIDDHHLSGHTPFRQWCSACVMGSAQSNPHQTSQSEDQAIPVVSMDYGYMESQNEDKGMPMLVMKDRSTKGIYADVVQEKGVN